MTTSSTAAATASPDAHANWVLVVSFDNQQVSASGVPLARRGPFAVFVDGCLCDREELAEIAQLPVHSTNADLVLAAYERRGESMLAQLRGSFVVAVIDFDRNVATIVRDPLGSHPLFYTQRSTTDIRFASSPQWLLRLPDVPRALNRLALADHLCKRWPDREETYFEAIKRVPAGSCVVISRTGIHVQSRWSETPDEIDFMSPADAMRFDEHFDRAVRRCLGHGRAGIFLSGGFDSVSVAAVATDLAAKHGYAPLSALSLAFPHPECDERLVQRSVAKRLGLPLVLVDFDEAAGPEGLLAAGLTLNKQLSAPLINTWLPAYLALSRDARSRGVSTILTGEGGDEWLGVSPYLNADLIRRGDIVGLIRQARTWHRSFQLSLGRVVWGSLWTYGLRPLAGAAIAAVAPAFWDRNRARRLLAGDPSWMAPDGAVRAGQKRRALKAVPAAIPKGGFYARESRVYYDHPLQSLMFEEQHALGCSLGLRYLHPYWDTDLLAHLVRIPPEVLNQGNRTKALVRESVARRFPNLEFRTQRKIGAMSFFTSIVTRQASKIAAKYTDFSALSALGIVDAKAARAWTSQAWDRGPRAQGMAWNLVNVESWVRSHL